MPPVRAPGPFRYQPFEIDADASTLTCRYELGPHRFAERFTFEGDVDWTAPGVEAAARLVALLAAVSYYKTGAPPVVELGDLATTESERALLAACIHQGLGEFAHRNALDLSNVVVSGPDRSTPAHRPAAGGTPSRPLVPFGGGIDSIVTSEAVRRTHPDTELFVMSRPGDRFAAIEAPAAVTTLEIRRVGREIDPQVLESEAMGFLNGHVPVTAILSAVAVMAATLAGRDAVVMSNEWSASIPTITPRGPVNHQWSKSESFENLFRRALGDSGAPLPDYFSLLRARSELWVARRFADLPAYLTEFRSCNRSFTQDPSRRLDHWCGSCDKCCFIDLILSPFLDTAKLEVVFGGHEPLTDGSLVGQFRALLGLTPVPKPFECVGDTDECRTAVLLAAARPDRASTTMLQNLAIETREAGHVLRDDGRHLFDSLGNDHVPNAYAPDNQLV